MKKNTVAIITAIAIIAITSKTLLSLNLGDKLVDKVIKGVAITVLTDVLSDDINKFINTITLNKGVPTQASTKVVPIIAMGSGTRVGAAQVNGPKELVEKVEIVVQIETKFSAKNLDVEVFVPSDSINPLKFNRVEGVGISALIDLRLSGI